MKLRRFITLSLVIIILAVTSVGAYAGFTDLGKEKSLFQKGVGPKVNGYTIDYRYFTPVTEGDTTKYPLVIWLHGMWNGTYDGKQISSSDIAAWAAPEYQSRFKDTGGAFILAPRSLEEKGLFWANKLIVPLRSTIDDFIAKHKDNIDPGRIYLGGYSMGGKMTLKLAIAYPDMFAAIYPICPKWVPKPEAAARISHIPIWLTASKKDPLVNYYTEVVPTWETLINQSLVAEDCRFSTLEKTVYPDGSRAPTPHDVWYAVNHDLFSDDNGDYPTMTTVNGKGETLKLTYPNGVISWLSGCTSDYDGTPFNDSGNSEAYKASALSNIFVSIYNLFRNMARYM